MLSTTEALRQNIYSFLLGFRTFSQSLIIASDLEEEEFRFIWNDEKENFIKENPSFFNNYIEVEYDSKISSKSIYRFLHKNNTSTIFFNSDDAIKILKSSACIKLIEGAVCSSPDSGSKWSVSYENHKSFMFKRYIIMHIKTDSIKWDLSKYHYLLRDGIVITNLNEFTVRINKLE